MLMFTCSPNNIPSYSLLIGFLPFVFLVGICGRDNRFARDETFWVAFEETWCTTFQYVGLFK